MAVPRVCVVGAGPAGLSMLIQMKFRQEEAGSGGPFEVVCFEKQSTWGGVWNYSWRTGKLETFLGSALLIMSGP